MSNHEYRERPQDRPGYSPIASEYVNAGLEGLEARNSQLAFIYQMRAMERGSLSPAEQGFYDGALEARMRLNNTLYRYNYEAGKIAEGLRQLHTAFGKVPPSAYGGPEAKTRTVNGIDALARRVAADPAEERRLYDESRAAREASDAADAAAEEERRANIESRNLNQKQADILATPGIKVGDIIKKVREEVTVSDPVTDEERLAQMAQFKELLKVNVNSHIKKWVSDHQKYINPTGASETQSNWEDAWTDQGLGRNFNNTALGHGVNAGASVVAWSGVLGGAGNPDFKNMDPVMSHVFSGAEGAFLAKFKAGEINDEYLNSVVGPKIDELFPDGVSFEAVESLFGTYNKPDEELTSEELEEIVARLERIPKYFRHYKSDLVKQYDRYLRKTGQGAMEFKDWLFTSVELGTFQKMFFGLIFQFPGIADWITDWFDGDESGKTEAQKAGETLHHYRELLEEENGTPTDRTEVPAESRVESDTNYQALITQINGFRQSGDPEVDIRLNGQPLAEANINDIQTSELTVLRDLLAQSNGYKLFLKGNELSDLHFLATHVGAEHADGIDVTLKEGGIRLDTDIWEDIQSWTAIPGWMDTIIGGGALIGGGYGVRKGRQALAGKLASPAAEVVRPKATGSIARFAQRGPGWLRGAAGKVSRFGGRGKLVAGGLLLLDGIIGGTIVERLGRMDTPFGGRSLDYADMTPQKLHNLIRETQEDVGIIREHLQTISFEQVSADVDRFRTDFAHRFDPEALVPRSLVNNQNFVPTVDTLVKMPNGVWGAFKFETSHLETLANFLASPLFAQFSNLKEEGGTIKATVNGTEQSWDNVEAFIEWVETQNNI